MEEGVAVTNHELSGETAAAPGRRRHWLVGYYPVRAQGECLGVGIVVNEVTEPKQAQERRQQLQAERDTLLRRLQLQIKRMPLAYILFDPALRVIDRNPAAEKAFGYTKQEALGMAPPFAPLLR